MNSLATEEGNPFRSYITVLLVLYIFYTLNRFRLKFKSKIKIHKNIVSKKYFIKNRDLFRKQKNGTYKAKYPYGKTKIYINSLERLPGHFRHLKTMDCIQELEYIYLKRGRVVLLTSKQNKLILISTKQYKELIKAHPELEILN